MFLPFSLLLGILGLPPPTIGFGGTEAWLHSAVTAGVWTGYYVIAVSIARDHQHRGRHDRPAGTVVSRRNR